MRSRSAHDGPELRIVDPAVEPDVAPSPESVLDSALDPVLLRGGDADADPLADRRWGEHGMATAELLGNAALGIAALVAIWAVLQAVGLDVMEWIRAQLQV